LNHPKNRLIALGLIALLALGVIVPLRIFYEEEPQSAVPWVRSMVHLMERQGLSGDPDAGPAASPGNPNKEGPIRSKQGLEFYKRAFPKMTIPPDAYANGISASNYVTEIPANMGWRELGPIYAPSANFPNPQTGATTAVSGRVSALAVDPASCAGDACQTIYAGAANGGIWKTTDAGKTWKALTDRQLNMAVGVITLDPRNSNIVYVGTGEPNWSCDSQHGIGVLRSTDGGQTWTNLGYQQFVNRAISAIIIDPRTAGSTNATLYVSSFSATSNNSTTESCDFSVSPYRPARGVYITKDGGNTWALSQPADAPFGIQSLVMDPGNPNVLYGGFTFAGVYKSTDAGQSWAALTQGLPSPRVGFDRITLAIAPSNPQVLYASYDQPVRGTFKQVLYTTTNGGASWAQKRNTPNACDQQCWYDMPQAVDHTDPNVVYAGGMANYSYLFSGGGPCATFSPLDASCNTTLMKTTNGGDNWSDIAENGQSGPLHPDDHVIVISPANHNVVYTGGDGGVFYSANGGQGWVDLNKGLATLQFQGLAVGPTGNIFAGTHDTGTFTYAGSSTWTHVNGGDGGPTAADPTSANTSYNSYYGAQLFRNDSAGDINKNVWIAPFWGDFFLQGLGQFYEPYALAPSQPSTIYYGTYRIWRSLSRGGSDGNGDGDATNDASDTIDWVPISFDLSCAAQQSTTCGGGIASIAVSATDPNVVAVGTSNGQLWLTKNALAPVKTDTTCDPRTNSSDVSKCNYVSGPIWTRIDAGLPQRYPTAVKFAPGSTSKLYVSYSGFSANTPTTPGHVFVSSDSGASWSRLDGSNKNSSLPDLPVNDILINAANGHLYVAADYGVFFSPSDGGGWKRMDFGLANHRSIKCSFMRPTMPCSSRRTGAESGRGLLRSLFTRS
jgi:photosystem II stability/assembly factor-like uncharacterized protein